MFAEQEFCSLGHLPSHLSFLFSASQADLCLPKLKAYGWGGPPHCLPLTVLAMPTEANSLKFEEVHCGPGKRLLYFRSYPALS